MSSRLKSGTLILSFVVLLSLPLHAFAQRRGGGSSRSNGSHSTYSPSRVSTGSGVGTSHKGHVSVSGYIKRDGTYVAPHHRSQPDGNFWNNWSTIGNVNPDTGKPGTKTSPPPNYRYGSTYRPQRVYPTYSYPSSPSQSIEQRGEDRRDSRTVSTVTSSPFSVSGSTTTSSTPRDYDSELRMKAAERLQRRGLQVNWQDHSFSQLSDWELRMGIAERLRRKGLEVDWQKHSFSEMSDWELRMGIAERLRRKGLDVDWQKHSFSEMSDWELRMGVAERLQRKGINVNWKDYTFRQLSDMDWKAR